MTVFCNEMAGPVGDGTAADVTDLSFSKVFGTFFCSILTAKLTRFVPVNLQGEKLGSRGS